MHGDKVNELQLLSRESKEKGKLREVRTDCSVYNWKLVGTEEKDDEKEHFCNSCQREGIAKKSGEHVNNVRYVYIWKRGRRRISKKKNYIIIIFTIILIFTIRSKTTIVRRRKSKEEA